MTAHLSSLTKITLNHHFASRVSRILVRSMSSVEGPVQSTIQDKIKSSLQPVYLDVINESYMHNVPKGSESHFKVTVVSDAFEGKPLIKRHRMVNEILKEELQNLIHALTITAKTPAQWDQSKIVQQSPKCLGGFGK